ncbi:MAG TPA: TonB C-terminal domain-containing protein [Verrucomicrobiae bacterium]|nr:TonB C-terminal domain-containing protein [Verrucomicrobiae bacterium]
MLPSTPPRKPKNSSRVNLLISLIFHGLIVLVGFYLAARGGLLGKEMRKIAVFKAEEPKPEKKPEPEKPKVEPPKIEPPKQVAKVEAPKVEEPQNVPPPISAPPVAAPAAAEIPSFTFEGGAAVETASGPVDVYKGLLQYAFTSKWQRPEDEEDANFVAEVDVSVGRDGRISNPQWIKKSGDKRWDDSVRNALAQVSYLDHAPPTNFPSHVIIRFDVVEQTGSIIQ